MPGVPAIGPGPIAFTDGNGNHQIISLTALSFENGTIKIDPARKPYSSANASLKKYLEDWVGYIGKQELLQADTSGAKAPAGPAFLIEATHVGATSNDIKVTTANVTPQVPPETSTLDLDVTVVNNYTGLSLATIADVIGTADGAGSHPGLLFMTAPAPPPVNLPDAGTFNVTGTAPPQAKIPSGANQAFTLEARPDGGSPGTFKVDITAAVAGKFDMKVTWSKAVANKTLGDHATAFAYMVKITAPPAGYGVPSVGVIALAGGTDPGAVPMPPQAAKASAPPAP